MTFLVLQPASSSSSSADSVTAATAIDYTPSTLMAASFAVVTLVTTIAP
jgi:hypothetical protein